MTLRAFPTFATGAQAYDLEVAAEEIRTPLGEYLGAMAQEGFWDSSTGIAIEQTKLSTGRPAWPGRRWSGWRRASPPRSRR